MADVRRRRGDPIVIHEDESDADAGVGQDSQDELDESRDPLADSGCTRSESSCSDDESDLDENVAEDMLKFEESFRGITKRYRLVNRIGEGWDRGTYAPCSG